MSVIFKEAIETLKLSGVSGGFCWGQIEAMKKTGCFFWVYIGFYYPVLKVAPDPPRFPSQLAGWVM